jgi:hypothetical protein
MPRSDATEDGELRKEGEIQTERKLSKLQGKERRLQWKPEE